MSNVIMIKATAYNKQSVAGFQVPRPVPTVNHGPSLRRGDLGNDSVPVSDNRDPRR